MSDGITTLCKGNYISLVKEDSTGWEYAHRPSVSGIVVILATTQDNELILIEQRRPPVNATVLELPAGLAGDTAEYVDEDLLAAARRELLEETGFYSDDWSFLFACSPSAGITSEVHNYVRARFCRRIADGGGDESESIETVVLPCNDFFSFVRSYAARPGFNVSSTVLVGAALWALEPDVGL